MDLEWLNSRSHHLSVMLKCPVIRNWSHQAANPHTLHRGDCPQFPRSGDSCEAGHLVKFLATYHLLGSHEIVTGWWWNWSIAACVVGYSTIATDTFLMGLEQYWWSNFTVWTSVVSITCGVVLKSGIIMLLAPIDFKLSSFNKLSRSSLSPRSFWIWVIFWKWNLHCAINGE